MHPLWLNHPVCAYCLGKRNGATAGSLSTSFEVTDLNEQLNDLRAK